MIWGYHYFWKHLFVALKRLRLQQLMSPQLLKTQDSYHQLRIRTGEEMRAKIQVTGSWVGVWLFFRGWTLDLLSRWWGWLGGGNSNMFYFHPYLGKIPILTSIFQRGWNHQPVCFEWILLRFLRGATQVFRGRKNDWICWVEGDLGWSYGKSSSWKTTIWGIYLLFCSKQIYDVCFFLGMYLPEN